MFVHLLQFSQKRQKLKLILKSDIFFDDLSITLAKYRKTYE